MKYTPIMEKIDLPARAELLQWDPKALVASEEKAFHKRVVEVYLRAEDEGSQVILLSGPTSSGKTTASRILSEGLGRGGHIADGGPVEALGGGLAVEAQPGAHHQLKHAVPQVGQPQAADGPYGVGRGIQMEIIGHRYVPHLSLE